MLFSSVFIDKRKFLPTILSLSAILVFQSNSLLGEVTSVVASESVGGDHLYSYRGSCSSIVPPESASVRSASVRSASTKAFEVDGQEVRIKALEEKLASLESLLKVKDTELDEESSECEGDPENVMTTYESKEKSVPETSAKPDVKEVPEKAYVKRFYGDKNWELSIGGRFFYDGMGPAGVPESLEAAIGDISSRTELRKGRICVNGHSKESVNFKMEFEFAGGDADYTDIYLSLPVDGDTKTHIGRQKEPFGMEQASSSCHLPFMERSLVTRSIMPARSTGFTLLNRKKPTTGLSWLLGYFRNTNSYGIEDDKSGQNITGRLVYLPRYENRGETFLHLGSSYSYHHPDNGEIQIKGKVGSNLLPDFGDTGVMDVEHSTVVGGEVAWQHKSVFVQAELAKTVVSLESGENADFSGYYLSAGWFLTGEHRNYSKSYGSFSSVKPKKNFNNWSGGAIQLVTRYHALDLNDSSAGISGGKVREFDFGINWYLNKGSRIMLDYMRPTLSGEGTANIVQMRFQVAF